MASMGRISIDDRELRQLEVDISGAPARVRRNAQQGTVKAARRIDREMTVDATGHKGNYFGKPGTSYRLTGLPRKVTHQLITPLEAEIGIEKGGQGSLAHIIVHGSVNNSPAYDYLAGPTRAMPEVEKIYADLAEDSVLGGRE